MKANIFWCLVGLMISPAMLLSPPGSAFAAETNSKYLTIVTEKTDDGKSLDKNIIGGPPTPPPGYEREREAVELPEPNPAKDEVVK